MLFQFKTFQFKTIVGIAVIETLMLAFLILTMTNILKDSQTQSLQHQALSTATLFAATTKDAVLTSDLATLESFVDEVMKNSQLLYARVKDENGAILAERHRSDQTRLAVFSPDMTVSSVRDGSYDVFAKISEADYQYGRVELGFNVKEADYILIL